MFPKLSAWHEYLYRERDPHEEALVYIRHPWESGMDNSPMWDAIMQGIFLKPEDVPAYKRADTHVVSAQDRPESAEYDRFAYLVKFFADRGYDEDRIREDCPFLVQDVLFNSLLVKAGENLSEIARAIGEDPGPFEAQSKKTKNAVNAKLWDEKRGTYLGFDLASRRRIGVLAATNLAGPLYAGIPDGGRAGRVVGWLEGPTFGPFDETAGGVPVPS